MTLESRLRRMEETEARSHPQAERRVIRIVAGEHDRHAALELAKEHGFDPDDENSNDLIILRSIKTMPGKPPYSELPRLG